MYKYETHLHTSPVSRCAGVGVEDYLKFYKKMGYDGVFITNHFIDGHINIDEKSNYKAAIDYYFSDYEKGLELSKDIGIKVFHGAEISYKGTDFLVYGLDKEWYLSHPEILEMTKREELEFMIENGAFIVQAHPFREAGYIDHIRLFPRSVHGVEVINACRTEFENKMADIYAQNYGLLKIAGSDNHIGSQKKLLAGICCEEPIIDEKDFIEKVKLGKTKNFTQENTF